ncbi:MAG: hypothetical protein JNK05_00055 [Myxococcales bacterium]|nr:hypothetical protein [Myxococcales bacterium]
MRDLLSLALRPLSTVSVDRPVVVSAGALSARACVALARASRTVVLVAKEQAPATNAEGPIVVAARRGRALRWAQRAASTCERSLLVASAVEPPLLVTTEAPAHCATDVIERSERQRLTRMDPTLDSGDVEVMVTSDPVASITDWAFARRAVLIVASAGTIRALQRIRQCFCSRLIDRAESSVAIVPT